MKKTSSLIAIALVCALLGAGGPLAGTARGDQNHVVIGSAAAGPGNSLTITGSFEALGSEPPIVMLNGIRLVVGSATADQIVAALPAGLPPATYLLSVGKAKHGDRASDGEAQRAFFDVTIGVGAQGPVGPQGPAGASAPVRAFIYSNVGLGGGFFVINPATLGGTVTQEAEGVFLVDLTGPPGSFPNVNNTVGVATPELNFGTPGSAGTPHYATASLGPADDTHMQYRVRTFDAAGNPATVAWNLIILTPQ